MFSFLNNIPQVTKNILILNVLLYILSLVLLGKGIDLGNILSAHYVNSPLFQPYQAITHMFMHSSKDFMHILFNMLFLVTLGSQLERYLGQKKFFILYFTSGLGAFFLYNFIGVWELMELKRSIVAMGYDLDVLNHMVTNGYFDKIELLTPQSNDILERYIELTYSDIVGASGAVYGVMAAFVVLFPNTEFMLLIFPFPIKAKYLIGAYLVMEVVNTFKNLNDQIAHLAHVGGAIFGIVLILIWRKTDRKNFW